MTRFHMVPLAECCKIVSGATPSTSVDAYWDGEIPWATPKDLSDLEGLHISRTGRTITQSGLNSCAATILPAGSVLFSSRAPIGYAAINTVPMATNQGFKSLVPKSERLHAGYLLHWLRTNRKYLESLGNGATFKEISKATMARIEIPLLPVEEQCRIAVILDKADKLRAKRKEALALLDSMAQSIFVEMFGDPVANPKQWPAGMLADFVSEMQYGPRFYNETYSSNGIRIVRITDLDASGTLDFDAMPKMSIDEEAHGQFILQAGDVIFARTGATVGKVALISESDPPCIAGAYFIRMRFGEKVLPEYALAVLQSKSIQALVAKQSRQAAQQNFSGPGLRRLPMPLPPLHLQTRYKERVESMKKEIAIHRQSMSGLNAMFESLQHHAFRGDL